MLRQASSVPLFFFIEASCEPCWYDEYINMLLMQNIEFIANNKQILCFSVSVCKPGHHVPSHMFKSVTLDMNFPPLQFQETAVLVGTALVKAQSQLRSPVQRVTTALMGPVSPHLVLMGHLQTGLEDNRLMIVTIVQLACSVKVCVHSLLNI